MTFPRPVIGAALLTLAALALPTFAMPHDSRPDVSIHRDTRSELADVNLAAAVAVAQAQADGPDGLPATWCGDDTSRDNTVNATSAPTDPQFKVVYAYAADRPNRFAGFRDALQADVAITERYLSAQSGGTRAIRFDMGTSCGPQYVDLQVVALPGPRSAYAGDFGAITSAVNDALGGAPGPRNTVILADTLAPTDVEFGLGETIMGAIGEQPGAANPHNRGDLRSVLFTKDGAPEPGAARGGWWPEGFLHEMTHNLGAVQWGAPHSTQPAGGTAPQYGHCWQGADVMCYVEDGGAAHPMQQDCAPIAGTITQGYDCGRDDYFNPAPEAGSYLATHWNTYDSVFMATCVGIAPACGGGELWVPTPPAATVAPEISGAARRGTSLRSGQGTWINRPSSYVYTWQRQAGGRWTIIEDAEDSPSYLPTGEDLGRRLRVTVSAENTDGTTASTSMATAPVAAVGISRATKSRHTRSHAKARAKR